MDETSPPAAVQVLDLLRRLYVERRSGELHLDRGDEHRGLAIREGHVVYARSDVPGERVGDVLVRHGDLTQTDLEACEARARSERRLLGAVLVEAGRVQQAQLDAAIACHVREILFSTMDEPGTVPSFEPAGGRPDDSTGWAPASRLSTGQLLLDASRRLDPAVVREALGDKDRKLVLATDPWLRSHPVALTPTDGFVLSRVDGTLSVRELVDLIALPAEDTEKSLLGLLCTGALAYAAARPAGQGTGSFPKGAPAGPALAAAGTPPAAATPAAALSATAATPVGAAPEAASARSAAPTPAEVRRLVLDAHASLAEQDHFDVLGITPATDEAGLRTAYARLARMLHPDACRDPLLADVTEQREAVFVRVREAYEALRDPRARAEHAAQHGRNARALAAAPPPPAGGPVPDEQLEQVVASGEELCGSGQYGEAIQKIEAVLHRLEGGLRARARMTLARASMRYPEWRRRAEAHLQEVIREDPAVVPEAVRVEACLLLGDLYKASELPVRAAAMYRKALTTQPGNRHALRELAGLEGAATPSRGTASLLGFLKKR